MIPSSQILAFSPQNVKLPWYEGLVGTRFNQTGVTGQEIQTEYFVPYSNGTQAIQAVSLNNLHQI